MKRWLIAATLLFTVALIAGCDSTEKTSKIQKDMLDENFGLEDNELKEKIKMNNYERFDLLMSKSRNDTKLYGTKFENNSYVEMHLELGEKFSDFIWSNVSEEGYMPQLNYCDLTGDSKDELVITTTLDVKGNYLRGEAHLVDTLNMEEIDYESAYENLQKRVRVIEDSSSIKVLLDNNEITSIENTDMQEDKTNINENVSDLVMLSDGIHYEVNNNIFQGFVILKSKEGLTLGVFELNYKYNESKNKLEVDKVMFNGVYEN